MLNALKYVLFGLAVFFGACSNDDNDGPPNLPGVQTQIRCFDWDGGREFIVVERPVDRQEAARLKLCFLNAVERAQYGKNRRCYFDCPPELRDFSE